jgi:LysM repeat protein
MAGGALGILRRVDRICPLLGLDSDRRVAIDGADGAHRCHATETAAAVARPMQSQLCLTASHDRCERYRQYVARTGIARPGRAAVADGLVSTRLVLTPEPAWRGIAGRARAARTGTAAALGAGAVALGVIGVAASTMLPGSPVDLAELLGPPPSSDATGTAAASATPEPVRTATPLPSMSGSVPAATPSSTPGPSATATLVPTAAPVATPAPTPTRQVTYTVAAGDTLALIAQRFGTTVAALEAANGIEDPNEIIIGQVLVIP